MLSAIEEASLYHNHDDFGYVALLRGSKQRIYHEKALPCVLAPKNGWIKDQDVWLSQCDFFKRSRRTVHLLRIGLLFADLDVYKTPLATGRFPFPPWVEIRFTFRQGGFSQPPFNSFNLGLHVGDDPEDVRKNRILLDTHLPASPHWLEQNHTADVIELPNRNRRADASIARAPEIVCAVLTADCLPILLADRESQVIAAIHAGWRGLVQGIIEETVKKIEIPSKRLWAYLGPAIGPEFYEVGDEMMASFPSEDHAAFIKKNGRWHCDLFSLAEQRLSNLGIISIFSERLCTYSDSRLFSYRREKTTGRMASLIWLAARKKNP